MRSYYVWNNKVGNVLLRLAIGVAAVGYLFIYFFPVGFEGYSVITFSKINLYNVILDFGCLDYDR